jgi:hypothetical protein
MTQPSLDEEFGSQMILNVNRVRYAFRGGNISENYMGKASPDE